MIVYWIMFSYVAVFGYVVQTYFKKNNIKTKYDSKISLLAAILVFALPVFFIGMRSGFADTYAYIREFNALTTDFSELWAGREDVKGIGFDIYMFVIKKFISTDFNVFLMITAVIQGTAVMKIYYKYSTNFTYSTLLFFFSMSFTNMMNGMRQFLAASLIFLFSEFLFEKKTILFFAVVALACTIHISAVIWFPIYFVVQGKPWNIKVMLSMLAIVIAILAIDKFTGLLSESLEGTNYEGYTDQFKEDDGANIVHTLIAAVPVILALWKRKEIEAIGNKNIYVLINCSIIEVLLNLLAKFTSGILIGRLPSFLTPFAFVILPWMFENTMQKKDMRLIRALCLILYLLFAVYYMNTMGMYYVSSALGINAY